MKQEYITPNILSEKILKIARSPELLSSTSLKLASMKCNAEKLLADVVEKSIIKKRK